MAYKQPPVAGTVLKFIEQLLVQAVTHNSSDIHIESSGRMRFRMDGKLQTADVAGIGKNAKPLSAETMTTLVAAIKGMAGLDQAERRQPQDGRFEKDVYSPEHGQRKIEVRVSIFPVVDGEKIALRLIDPMTHSHRLDKLNIPPFLFQKYDQLVRSPSGMVIITGPTGSGKTTTLYASLRHAFNQEKCVCTIEDPVEYNIKGFDQSQINPRIGLSFSRGLKAILRQDPDIIMVGEVRDEETAEIAIQAALTGHLVFTTVHAEDAIGAIPRLLEIGVKPYSLSTAVAAVMNQRLLRKLCEACRKPYDPAALDSYTRSFFRQLTGFDPPPEIPFMRAVGCSKCVEGYRGRIACYELLILDESLRALLNQPNFNEVAFREKAVAHEFVPLAVYMLFEAVKGNSSLEEISRFIALKQALRTDQCKRYLTSVAEEIRKNPAGSRETIAKEPTLILRGDKS